MNTAKFLLGSMEKTASKGLVMAAVEAATGAAIGGTLGLSKARAGRESDPLGSSDLSGAAYGAIMGALAGAGAGAVIRDSVAQRGIRTNQRLKSLAESVSAVENRAAIAKANVDAWNSGAVRDLLYSQNHPGETFSQVTQQRDALQEILKRHVQEKNHLQRQVRAHRRAGTPDHFLEHQLDSIKMQIGLDNMNSREMDLRLKEIKKLEKGDFTSAKSLASQYETLAKQRREELDAYKKIVEQQERAKANSKFMGLI